MMEVPCYFLPEETFLSEGLALFYTHKIKLRFPEGIQTGLHFVIIIAPTRRMTKEDYEQAIKDLSWQLCTIKASAEMKELISHDDDLEGVEDFRMNELYWLMEIWHIADSKCNGLHSCQRHSYMDRIGQTIFSRSSSTRASCLYCIFLPRSYEF